MAFDVLVDTSVWVDHFRKQNTSLVQLISSKSILIHPFVIGEIACGTPPDRQQTLNHLSQIKGSQEATSMEVRAFIEHNQIYGKGCGLVDITLLASVQKTQNARIWTKDKRLAALAIQLGLNY